MVFVPDRKHTYGPPRPVTDSFTFAHADDVRTSQETQASTACYGDSFAFLYVNNVRTSLDSHLWKPTACYGDSLTVLDVDDVRISQKAQVTTSW
jgi:hypothetical protein